MSNSIFMLSKYLKKTVTTALILGLMISPILPATQSISSSISIAAQAAEIEVQLEEAQAEEAQATTGYWSEYTNTDWYYNTNPDESTYTIATAEELAGLAKLVNDGTDTFEGKTIKLTGSIDLGNHKWVPIGVGSIEDEFGETKDVFKGTFDGQDIPIKNMFIGTSEADPAEYDFTGLFGIIEGATILNVNIDATSKNYASDGQNGGICGYAEDSTIINCSNNSYISSEYRSGGICGSAVNSTIIRCSNSGVVFSNGAPAGGICGSAENLKVVDCDNSGTASTTNYYTGGICGEVDKNSTISNCTNTGDISSNGVTGGICGKVDKNSTISKCTNTGDISSSSDTGGICGYASTSTISKCTNTGDISSNMNTGGICGAIAYMSTVSNCSNIGTVDARLDAGGVCGAINDEASKISNCVNSGNVASQFSSKYTAGGVCGNIFDKLSISNCYYKQGTANRGVGGYSDVYVNVTALPESQMKATTGTKDVEDWVDITIDGDDKGKMALVDALNNYVDNNLSDGLLNWIQNDNVNEGYPTIVTNNNNAN